MKITVVIILVVLMGAVLFQSYFILKERNQLKADVSVLGKKIEELDKENKDLNSELEYFSHPENLEKELRSKFNYKYPDEKMMIIVP